MICWLNPATGLSGDMLLGALLDAGADLDAVRSAVADTGLTGWSLDAERVGVDGIQATKAVVETDDDATHRHASVLIEHVRRTSEPAVARLAERAVRAIAEVEGALHGEDPERVHLHEIGGLDTVVDTVGVAAALFSLGVEEVYSSPLGLGGHRVGTAHGVLPAPAPATARLLIGARIAGLDVAGETVTPTGAALVRAAGTRFAPPPEMVPTAVGHGAGTKRFPGRPNVLQVILGAPARERPEGPVARRLVQLEANLDDVTGELLGHLIDAALDRGALDAWAAPIVMKKGRPAHTLSLLVPSEGAADWRTWLLAETGSLGVRETEPLRFAVDRSWSEVTVHGRTIRMKHGPWGVKPEHDDIAAASAALGIPWRRIALEAHKAAFAQDTPAESGQE